MRDMTPETEKQSGNPHPCIICGKPIAKGNYCNECVDRFGFCEGCEGRALADVEEE